MNLLEKKLRATARDQASAKPVFFDLKKEKDRTTLNSLLAKKKILRVSDDYEEQQRELFAIKNPTTANTPEFGAAFKKYSQKFATQEVMMRDGKWVYFSWLSSVVHVLGDKDFQLLRTARNRNLIREGEQKKFYGATVGIAGLSVGSSVALAIVLQGGAHKIRIADHDDLALSNMNRIRSGIQDLGLLKVEMAARQIYEINPYAKVEIMPDGLTPTNIKKFFAGLDIVIDEVDHLGMKYMIREYARANRLAVVMGADNGDSAVVDIERYDLDPKTKFFHGRLGNDISFEILANLKKFEIGRMITKHVGPENVTERMRESLLEMGKTVVSWPQLGGAAMINGAAVAYCVRKILNGEKLEGNRAIVSLDEKFIPGYFSPAEKKRRAHTAEEFRKIFKL